DVRRADVLAAVAAEVGVAQVIGEEQDDVGLVGRRGAQSMAAKNAKRGKNYEPGKEPGLHQSPPGCRRNGPLRRLDRSFRGLATLPPGRGPDKRAESLGRRLAA